MSAASRSIRLVVLDWAGTAVDFGCFGPVMPFVRALEGLGIELSLQRVRGPMGVNKKDHLRALLALPDVAGQWRRQHGGEWGDNDVDRIYHDHYMPLQLEAIEQHSRLVPGLLESVAVLRNRGVKIATTTGYFRAAAAVLHDLAQKQGFARDCDVLPDDVRAGRPAPWMMFKAMETLDVFPPAAVVKVGDTLNDIAEGRNAGAWSVGVIASSSEVGCTEGEWAALSASERRRIVATISGRFMKAGAHASIETLTELPEVIAVLERRWHENELPDQDRGMPKRRREQIEISEPML